MIVIPVLFKNRCLFGKRLANACSIPVDDIHDGVSRIFLTYFLEVMKEIEWLKTLKQKMALKLDVIAAITFTLIDVKGESG